MNVAQPIWENIYNLVKTEAPFQNLEVFFDQIEAHSWNGKELVLTGSDNRVVEHIRNNYSDTLLQFLQKKEGKDSFVTIKTLDMEQSFLREPTTKKKSAYERVKSEVYPNEIPLNVKYTFDRFIKGTSNEHALAASVGVAEKPTQYHNPLYLYGGVGLGKTHLMMAIGNHVKEQFPHLRVLYVTAEKFQNDLVEAMSKKKNLAGLRAYYRHADIFLIDDIQMIGQRAEYTQEEIFHTFNYLYQNGKHIVISGDRPPQQLSRLTNRLISRFQSGLMADIKSPNLETRMAILASKAKENQLVLPDTVLKFLAEKLRGHIRILESALTNLLFLSDLENRPIDLSMAKSIVRDLANQEEKNRISIDTIIEAVGRSFGIEEEKVKGKSRTEQVSLARHACMYLARKHIPALTLAEIATFFGRKDHTTVLHAEKKIKELLDNNSDFAKQIEEIIEDLN